MFSDRARALLLLFFAAAVCSETQRSIAARRWRPPAPPANRSLSVDLPNFGSYCIVSTVAGSPTAVAGRSNAAGTSALFSSPADVTLGPLTGNLYIADTGNNQLRMMAVPSLWVSLLAGGTGGGTGQVDGVGTAARFNSPTGLVAAPDESLLYVADKNNFRVRTYDLTVTNAGTATLAGTGFTGNVDGVGAAAAFVGPMALALDNAGLNLYVSDCATGCRIRAISVGTGTVTTLAGNTVAGFSDGAGTSATFSSLVAGLDLSPNDGALFIADTQNNALRVLSLDTLDVVTLAGNGTAGHANGGNLLAAVTFDAPRDIVVNASEGSVEVTSLVVAEAGMVRFVGVSLIAGAAWVAGTGSVLTPAVDGACATARVGTPAAMVGWLWGGGIAMVDTTYNSLRLLAGFPPSPTPSGTLSPTPSRSRTPSVSPTATVTPSFSPTPSFTPSKTPTPSSTPICVAPPGKECLVPGGSTATATFCVAGKYCTGNPARGVPCPLGRYGASAGLSTSACDGACSAPAGSVCTTGATSPVGAPCPWGAFCPGGASGASARCACPAGCTGGASNDTSLSMGVAWNVTTIAGMHGLRGFANGNGSLAAFDGAGGVAALGALLFVSDSNNNRVRLVAGWAPDAAPGAASVTTFAGQTSANNIQGIGTNAKFNNLAGSAVDATTGTIVVADTGSGALRRVAPGTAVVSLITSAINQAQGVTVNSSGWLFVANSNFHTIIRVPPSGAPVTVWGGAGAGYINSVVGSSVIKFDTPLGLAVVDSATGANATLLIADSGNNCIRLLQQNASGVYASTLAGSLAGTAGFREGAATSALFNRPSDIVYDPVSVRCFIADAGNARIRLLSVLGTYDVTTIVGMGADGGADGLGALASLTTSSFVKLGLASDGTLFIGADTTVRAAVCTPCPAGLTCDSWGAVLPCPAGYFCPAGAAAPIACPAGTFSSSPSASSAGACLFCASLGAFCPGGTVAPVPCPAGRYGAAGGLSSRTCSGPCASAPGFYCGEGSIAPSPGAPCPAGFFCPGGAAPPTLCSCPGACAAGGLAAAPAGVGAGGVAWVVTTLAGVANQAGAANGAATTVARLSAPIFAAPVAGTSQLAGTLSLLITDAGNNTLRRLAGGQLSTVAGNGSACWGDGAASCFSAPSGLAVVTGSSWGGDFAVVADLGNDRVRLVNLSALPPAVSTLAGGAPSTHVFNSAALAMPGDGTGAAVVWHYPYGVSAVSGGTSFLVVDAQLQIVRSVGAGGYVSLVAGYPSAGGAANGIGTNARFLVPTHAAATADGATAYVADCWGHKVRVIDLDTRTVGTLAGSGTGATVDGVGTLARFNRPAFLAVDPAGGYVFVSEEASHVVRRVVVASATVTTVAGRASVSGLLDGLGVAAAFGSTAGVALDAGGSLVIADRAAATVRGATCAPCPGGFYCPADGSAPESCPGGSYCPLGSTAPLPCAAAPGYGCYGGSANASGALCGYGMYCSGGAAPPRACVCPARCPAGTAAESMTLSYTWNVSTWAGSAAGIVDSPVGTTAKFSSPKGLSLSPATGAWVVADQFNHRLRAVAPNGARAVATLAGTTVGMVDGAPLDAKLYRPSGVWVQPSGGVIIADQLNNRLRYLHPNGALLTTLAGVTLKGSANGVGSNAQFFQPRAVCCAPDGDTCFVTEIGYHRVRTLAPFAAAVNFLAGNTAAGNANGAGTNARFTTPCGCAYDTSDGAVMVADYGNNLIRRVGKDGTVSTVAGGIGGTTDGVGTNAKFNRPIGVAFSVNPGALASANILYVTEYAGFKLRVISPTLAVTTVAGSGSSAAVDGLGKAAVVGYPADLAIDSAASPGALVFSDSGHHLIRAATCVVCPAGFTCDYVVGGWTTTPCAGVGNYCPAGSYAPLPCPAGTFQPLAFGGMACTPCPPGTQNTGTARDFCSPCNLGYYCPGGTVGPGVPCGAGNYCPAGSPAPMPCPTFGLIDATMGPSNGPAFDVDTAACLNHCYFGGPGQTSAC